MTNQLIAWAHAVAARADLSDKAKHVAIAVARLDADGTCTASNSVLAAEARLPEHDTRLALVELDLARVLATMPFNGHRRLVPLMQAARSMAA